MKCQIERLRRQKGARPGAGPRGYKCVTVKCEKVGNALQAKKEIRVKTVKKKTEHQRYASESCLFNNNEAHTKE